MLASDSQHTVLLNGLHCPTVTESPSSTRNAGDTCAARFLCRFSYLEYLGMKWRYSRRMTRVRCILVETTVPVRIRPRMETRPVKGHFLSVKDPQHQHCILIHNEHYYATGNARTSKRYKEDAMHTNICSLNRILRRPESQPNIFEPPSTTLSHTLALRALQFRVEEDVRLLLIRPLRLHG